MDRDRKNEILSLFEHVDDKERQLLMPLMENIVFLEERMNDLREMPFVRVHPKNPLLQKTTPAAKLYKECMQSYMNGIRILLNALRKVESSAADELMERLKEFSLDE